MKIKVGIDGPVNLTVPGLVPALERILEQLVRIEAALSSTLTDADIPDEFGDKLVEARMGLKDSADALKAATDAAPTS